MPTFLFFHIVSTSCKREKKAHIERAKRRWTTSSAPDSKAILTFIFTLCGFMLGYLLDNKTSTEVISAVTVIKRELLSHDLSFGALSLVTLTDNGGEFANVTALENSFDVAKEVSFPSFIARLNT
ncbi:MAG: hypothetical protein RSE58_09905 [Clostridia bacterium]